VSTGIGHRDGPGPLGKRHPARPAPRLSFRGKVQTPLLDAALRDFAVAVLGLLRPVIAAQVTAADLSEADERRLAADVELLTALLTPRRAAAAASLRAVPGRVPWIMSLALLGGS